MKSLNISTKLENLSIILDHRFGHPRCSATWLFLTHHLLTPNKYLHGCDLGSVLPYSVKESKKNEGQPMFYVGRVFDTVQGNFPLRKLAETTSPHFPLLSSMNLKQLSRVFSSKTSHKPSIFQSSNFPGSETNANGKRQPKFVRWLCVGKWPNTRVHIVKFLENRQKFGHLTA